MVVCWYSFIPFTPLLILLLKKLNMFCVDVLCDLFPDIVFSFIILVMHIITRMNLKNWLLTFCVFVSCDVGYGIFIYYHYCTFCLLNILSINRTVWCSLLLYTVDMSYCNKQFHILLDVHNECENLDVISCKCKINLKVRAITRK